MKLTSVCRQIDFVCNKLPKPGKVSLKRPPEKLLLIMKLTTILLLVTALQVSANGLSQKVTIAKKNASLEEIFEILQQQTGYSFILDSHMMARAKNVDIQVKDAPVKDVLDLCFKDQSFTYVIQDKIIVVKEKEEKKDELNATAVALPPPNQTISGIVKDSNNNPVEGANVTIKTLSIGTTTNKQGRF
jgi:type II secretory pathway component GspD/PulD (secretin)